MVSSLVWRHPRRAEADQAEGEATVDTPYLVWLCLLRIPSPRHRIWHPHVTWPKPLLSSSAFRTEKGNRQVRSDNLHVGSNGNRADLRTYQDVSNIDGLGGFQLSTA